MKVAKTWIFIIFVTLFFTSQALAEIIYFNDFESAVGPEWSHTIRDTTPEGARKFLGQFRDDTVTLTLNDILTASEIEISFDLFIIRSWDGNQSSSYPYNQDYWSLSVRNGPTLLHTTFSNSDNKRQSYPDWYPASYPYYTGADEIRTLGYRHHLYGGRQDAVYNLSFTIPYSSSVIFDFSASGLQPLYDESWGIDNVQVSTVPEPTIQVALDIKPGSCPNPVNTKSQGVLPIAILGSEELEVGTIVPTSVRLAGVEPIRDSLEDVAGPLDDPNECECTTNGADGFDDLTFKFYSQNIVEALGEVNTDDILTLPLTGVLNDGTPIEGSDCVVIVGRHKPINKADFNSDKVVDITDFATFVENWLQSSAVEE